MTQLIQPFVDKAYCKGWGTIYITDDLFDVGNPWDDPPTFWSALLLAATNIPTAASCGDDGMKVLVPLLGSDPAGECSSPRGGPGTCRKSPRSKCPRLAYVPRKEAESVGYAVLEAQGVAPCGGARKELMILETSSRMPAADLMRYSSSNLYVAPAFHSRLADTAAIIATADPGDYGDRITVAMNVEITATAESTDRAADVRDAGAKVNLIRDFDLQ